MLLRNNLTLCHGRHDGAPAQAPLGHNSPQARLLTSESLLGHANTAAPDKRPVTNCEQSRRGCRKATILRYGLLDVHGSGDSGPARKCLPPVISFLAGTVWETTGVVVGQGSFVWDPFVIAGKRLVQQR
jgi:hypothetical protein